MRLSSVSMLGSFFGDVFLPFFLPIARPQSFRALQTVITYKMKPTEPSRGLKGLQVTFVMPSVHNLRSRVDDASHDSCCLYFQQVPNASNYEAVAVARRQAQGSALGFTVFVQTEDFPARIRQPSSPNGTAQREGWLRPVGVALRGMEQTMDSAGGPGSPTPALFRSAARLRSVGCSCPY